MDDDMMIEHKQILLFPRLSASLSAASPGLKKCSLIPASIVFARLDCRRMEINFVIGYLAFVLQQSRFNRRRAFATQRSETMRSAARIGKTKFECDAAVAATVAHPRPRFDM